MYYKCIYIEITKYELLVYDRFQSLQIFVTTMVRS